MTEITVLEANFNPKVKNYWVLNAILICAFTIVGIPIIPVVGLVIWIISTRILKAMSARLMERKLVVKRGIFFVVEKSIPLEKITDVALSQGPIMRMFDLHRLSFETAGASGQGALVSLVGIAGAHQFRESILAQKDKLAAQQTPSQVAGPNKLEAALLSTTDIDSLVSSVKNIETMLEKLLKQKT